MRKVSLTVSKTPYSKSERELFKYIPKSGQRISSTQLTRMKSRSESWMVSHPRNNVTVTMQHLIAKVRHNREAFLICQSKRRGPHSIEYWIEMREKK